MAESTASAVVSEGRFRAAGDTSPVGFALYDPLRGNDRSIGDFRCTYVNQSGARLLGRTPTDMVGQHLTVLEPRAVELGKFAAYVRVVERGEPDERAFHYVNDGIDVTFHHTIVRVGSALAVTFSDVTEWLRAQEELEELRAHTARAERRAARILEQVRDAHVTLDREFRILSVNPAAETSLGMTSDTLYGRSYWEVLPDMLATDAGRAYQRIVAEGDEAHLTQEIRRHGVDSHLEIDAYPTDEGGVAIVWRDITAQVSIEKFQRDFARHLTAWNVELQGTVAERDRLLAESERARAQLAEAQAEREFLLIAERAARAEAEAANRSKSEFLAVMSHELRTPLNAIDGYAELMELGIRGPLTSEQRHDLGRIRKSERHLLGLINGVLNYARVEAGAVRFDFEEVRVEDILDACEALTLPQARTKGLQLTHEPCDQGLLVRADREKMQQVVLNLLSNAIKFTRPGGSVSMACARVGPNDSSISIEVRDNGIGIPPDQLSRVFEPFVQVDAQLTRTREGTGLGLAISRELARGMGGDLTVESTLGAGSTFRFTLMRVTFDWRS
jgi:PAS domain S-box-containing protein